MLKNLSVNRHALTYGLVAFLLLVFAITADQSIKNKSATFDETAHITAGLSYWKTGDFRLNPQNGIFPQAWASLPLLGMPIAFPSTDQRAWQERDVWELGHQLLNSDKNDTTSILRASRRMIIVIGVLTGLAVFFWSRQLWGDRGAILSLILFTFSPTILAHSRLATSDMSAAFGFILATAMLWSLSHKISLINISLAGLTLGLLALSKMSVILIMPIMLMMLLVRYFHGPAVRIALPKNLADGIVRPVIFIATFLLLGAIALIIINLAHISQSPGVFLDKTIFNQVPLILQAPLQWLHSSRLLPDSYLYGLAHTLAHTGQRLSFAAGQYSLNGWWWFFPFAFAVKTPLAILTAGFLFIVFFFKKNCTIKTNGNNQSALYRISPLLILIIVYAGAAIISHLNIGHRHLLPVYPPLFILLGGLATIAVKRIRYITLAICLLLITESLGVHPNYLSFFNRAAGGPDNGYRLLVDSSLDWGQDLPSLKKWLDQNNLNNDLTYLAYFGTADPGNYQINTKRLPGFLDRHYQPDFEKLMPGTYIISATLLQLGFQPPEAYGPWTMQQEHNYRILFQHISTQPKDNSYHRYERLRFGRLLHYLRQRQTDTKPAYSFLAYRLDDRELQDALSLSPPYNKQP